jgi:hypothetical protein
MKTIIAKKISIFGSWAYFVALVALIISPVFFFKNRIFDRIIASKILLGPLILKI